MLGAQAVLMLAWGVLLFARSGDASSVWPWNLSPLAAEASASWLLGIGGSAAYIALRGDRADLPGPAVSYIVLGTAWLAGAAGYGADFHSTAAAVPYVLFAISVLAVGVTGGSRGGRAATARRRGSRNWPDARPLCDPCERSR